MREQTPPILRHIKLGAESATNAWYQIKLLQFREGYVVEVSGRKGRLGDGRAWFFWDQREAEKAIERIVLEKTTSGRKRVYRVLSAP